MNDDDQVDNESKMTIRNNHDTITNILARYGAVKQRHTRKSWST